MKPSDFICFAEILENFNSNGYCWLKYNCLGYQFVLYVTQSWDIISALRFREAIIMDVLLRDQDSNFHSDDFAGDTTLYWSVTNVSLYSESGLTHPHNLHARSLGVQFCLRLTPSFGSAVWTRFIPKKYCSYIQIETKLVIIVSDN